MNSVRGFFLKITIIMLFFVLMINLAMTAWATEYNVTRLTDNYATSELGIHNGQVAWRGFDSTRRSYEIFLYSGISTIQLTNNDYDDRQPYIHNGQVVWSGFDGSHYQVFFYDGTQTRQLTNNNYDNYATGINNGKIVWSGYDGNDDEIFLYDGTQVIQLTNNNDYDGSAVIDNGQVAWEGLGIFLYDGITTTQLTDNGWSPHIHNGQIVWSGFSSDAEEIFLYEGGATRQITDNGLIRDEFAYINNGQIVWSGEEYYGVPDVANVFFYDGTIITQLTDYSDSLGCLLGESSPIHNGQAVWEADDGNDEEIFLYDGTKIIQLTDNDYDDFNPNIHNGQIAWYRDGSIFLATPITGCTLDILNGADFTAGQEVSNNPGKLLDQRTFMKGVTVDGTARLLLRLNVDQANRVEFSINTPYNPDEDGTLSSLDGTQKGMAIAVDTIQTSKGRFAFAIYQAPERFVRQSQPLDKYVSERNISIKVQTLNSPVFEFSKDIKLIRPPVVLLHGLWSGADMWTGFKSGLETSIPGIIVFPIDYKITNSAHLASNEGLLRQGITYLRCVLRAKGIAMVQADIFAHSMGGILARLHAGNFGVYKRPDNFYMGDINKLITIDSPHQGSFLAAIVVASLNNLDPITKNLLVAIAQGIHMNIDQGAPEDLNAASARINAMNKTPIDTPTHVMVGDYYVIGGNLDEIGNGMLRKLHKTLSWLGLICDTRPFIIQGRSDLVVSVDSQSGGMGLPALSTYEHDHLDATCDLVIFKAVDLLNTAPEDPSFQAGFPVQGE